MVLLHYLEFMANLSTRAARTIDRVSMSEPHTSRSRAVDIVAICFPHCESGTHNIIMYKTLHFRCRLVLDGVYTRWQDKCINGE